MMWGLQIRAPELGLHLRVTGAAAPGSPLCPALAPLPWQLLLPTLQGAVISDMGNGGAH